MSEQILLDDKNKFKVILFYTEKLHKNNTFLYSVCWVTVGKSYIYISFGFTKIRVSSVSNTNKYNIKELYLVTKNIP